MKNSNIKLIIGLGNPGPEYEKTRHNAGRIAVLELLGQHELECEDKKSNLIFEGKILGEKVMILLPQLLMNNSGKAVKDFVKKYKPAVILVAHDDIDIPLGSMKLSFGKHSAGHKGVESVMRAVGTYDFWRLRIGIAPSASWRRKKRIPAMQLVLKKFTPSEEIILKKIKKQAVSIIETAVSDSAQKAQML